MRLIDAKGQITRWDYDASNRAIKKTYADGNYDAFTYTQGVLSSTRSARGVVVNYSYDDNEIFTATVEWSVILSLLKADM